MKNILQALLIFGTFNFLNAQIVNIPDSNFKQALLNHSPIIDTNGDGEIQVTEALAFEGILNVSNKNIYSLVGIGAFENIIELNINYNNLTDINLNNNLFLERLFCRNNNLTQLSVAPNLLLEEIDCRNNNLSYGWFGDLTSLSYLNISYNNLTSLDLEFNSSLNELYTYANQLTSLDVSNNQALTILRTESNYITELDVSNNTALTYLTFANNQIENIDLSNNTELTSLSCAQNNLSEIDLSNNINLISFWGHFNNFVELDFSHNTNLINIWCNNNYDLTYINLRNGKNTQTSGQFHNLPNLESMCVDDVNNSGFINFILNQVGHQIDFTEDCNLNIIHPQLESLVLFYPNPVNTKLHIDFHQFDFQIIDVEIIDIKGKIIFQHQTSDSSLTIDMSGLQQGIYILKISSDFSPISINKKLVKF